MRQRKAPKRRISKKKLAEMIDLHKKWLAGDKVNGKKANFSYMNLSKHEFYGLNLYDVDFDGANLSNTRFIKCWLYNADMISADLTSAYFSSCDMSHVHFNYANLTGAHFYSTSLIDAKFERANMQAVYMVDCATFDASLDIAQNVPDKLIPLKCPGHGEFLAYKKVKLPVRDWVLGWTAGQSIIAELKIPAHALRSSGTSNKCRASEAEVVDFWDCSGNHLDISVAKSLYDGEFVYIKGATVKPVGEPFDTNRYKMCAPGIHFFMDFDEAVNYM